MLDKQNKNQCIMYTSWIFYAEYIKLIFTI